MHQSVVTVTFMNAEDSVSCGREGSQDIETKNCILRSRMVCNGQQIVLG